MNKRIVFAIITGFILVFIFSVFYFMSAFSIYECNQESGKVQQSRTSDLKKIGIYILSTMPQTTEGFDIISLDNFLDADFLSSKKPVRPLVILREKEKNFRFVFDNKPNLPSYHVNFDPLVLHITSSESFDGELAKFKINQEGEYGLNENQINPYRLPENIQAHKEKIAKMPAEKGIYITQSVANSSNRFGTLKQLAKSRGYNTFVIDVKYEAEKPFLARMKNNQIDTATSAEVIPWISNLTTKLKAEGFRVIGRMVVFKDEHLAIARPDLAIKQNGKLYRDHKGGLWIDPYSPEAQNYLALIAESIIKSGIDGVQFDYIRFPAEGESKGPIVLPFEDGQSRVKVICDFLKLARQRIDPYPNASIEFDIFGITAWQNKVDITKLGQDLKEISYYVDAICPMLYPSHFHSGYDGFKNPGSEPYYFVNTGVKKIKEIIPDKRVKIIPWIQGFALRAPNFGTPYIEAQIKAGEDLGEDSFLIWNAGNNYSFIPNVNTTQVNKD